MERRDFYQVGIEQEDYQDEEPAEGNLQSEGQNYFSPMHPMEVGNVQTPILYAPANDMPPPIGHIPNTYQYPPGTMVNVPNFLQAQSNYIQQPQSNENFMSFGINFPATYYYHESGEPSDYNVHNAVQNGSLYHPEEFDGNSFPLSCGGNNEDRYQYNGYRNWTPSVDSRNMNAQYSNIPQSSPSNISFPRLGDNMIGNTNFQGYGLSMGCQASSNIDYRRTNGTVHFGDSSLGGFGDASCVNADHCNCHQGPEAVSRPSSHREATLPNMNPLSLYRNRSETAAVRSITNGRNSTIRTSQVELSNQGNVSKMSSVLKKQNSSALRYGNSNTVRTSLVESGNQGNASKVSSVPNTRNSSEVQHVNDNAVKTSQIESSSNSLISRAQGGTKGNIHEVSPVGKPGRALQYWSTKKNNDFMLPVKSQSYCTPSSHQVWQKKAESQTSEKPSKVKMQPSEFPSKQPLKQIFPTNHIMWDGKTGHAPQCQPTQSSKNFMLPVQKIRSYSTPSSHQIWPKRARSQTSKKPSKQPSKQNFPTNRIKWNGFDDPTTQPLGQNCCLCGDDLAFSPTDEELEPSVLPEVAVLSCGHAFHRHCLSLSTTEEQPTDPPCFICVNGLS